MHICFISRRFFPTISGMSVYAANLLRELVRLGHDVTMVSQYRGDELGTRVYGGGPPPVVPGVRVIGLEALGEQNGGDFERDIATMVQTVVAEHRRQPFDMLHAQYGYPTGLAALEASKMLDLPNLVSIQGGDGHWVGTCCATHKAAMLAVLNHAGALLIGSRSFAEEVQHNHGTPLERFTIVPGAVEVERFRPRPGWQAGALREPSRPALLYHGRVDRRKGVLDLLEAMALLKQQRPASMPRLIISGIGPDSDAARERTTALSLHDDVVFTGYADYNQVPQVYHQGDLFVSPTYAEGFSNTILEAMASGLPIVSTATVGVVDCLRHDENGLLVPPGDVHALAEALHTMCNNGPLRTRLARQAFTEVQEQYAWPTIARQIAGVYEQLRGTRPDTNWNANFPVTPCRFRAEPHLL
ncbi:MAG: glycosyltransferase family 4 protein [Chloroflexaceae bacterium]|jgi:glycosyltransferase involved in cell wall biosynthesis|nr:glycosyltransferase family 4 protein [Chloroflexaceae bacterium]